MAEIKSIEYKYYWTGIPSYAITQKERKHEKTTKIITIEMLPEEIIPDVEKWIKVQPNTIEYCSYCRIYIGDCNQCPHCGGHKIQTKPEKQKYYDSIVKRLNKLKDYKNDLEREIQDFIQERRTLKNDIEILEKERIEIEKKED